MLTAYHARGCYTDCFTTVLDAEVSAEDYILAFYTTFIFKIERAILKLFLAKPSSDKQAKLLAKKEIDQFAAWHVEGRTTDQILLCDFQQKTRSWLKVEGIEYDGKRSTRLYFGSAVVPDRKLANGEYTLSLGVKFLLGFHKWYSRILLASAKRRLQKVSVDSSI
ncbi:hypothetical protein FLL45_02000 [Aliikangiella marina]|uniref:DUF2867 domain-containing protein n=1 Tax=Aliikangiella marina TaxID=1712262 RepID=A0A545TK43_9GAMM|nr:hypothetical protein FLL45_02000 [Aliikangiella marina]